MFQVSFVDDVDDVMMLHLIKIASYIFIQHLLKRTHLILLWFVEFELQSCVCRCSQLKSAYFILLVFSVSGHEVKCNNNSNGKTILLLSS